MFLVKNFVAYRCLPAAHEVFNFSPNEDIFIHPPNGRLRISLIPEQIVKQYNGTYKFVELSLFNKAGIGSIPCEISKNGLFHLILPEGKIIAQLRLSNSEIHVNIYISKNLSCIPFTTLLKLRHYFSISRSQMMNERFIKQ